MAQQPTDAVLADAPQTGWSVARSSLTEMSLGVTIVGAVAARTDRDPVALAPLQGAVDVDALERLCAPGRDGADPTVSFRYEGFDVTVTREELRLDPREGAATTAD